jgi:hypothetical protein
MPSSTKKQRKPVDLPSLFALMEPWPRSWAGSNADIPVGESLVAELKPFIAHLCSLGLAPSTVRNHLNNTWVIGGEIIREVVGSPTRRKLKPRRLLLDAIDLGEAPFVYGFAEEEQRSLDATARKLLRFLSSNH